jgi:hypothetical protein
VRSFESRSFSTQNKSSFKCAARDWGDEFGYVTGGGLTTN